HRAPRSRARDWSGRAERDGRGALAQPRGAQGLPGRIARVDTPRPDRDAPPMNGGDSARGPEAHPVDVDGEPTANDRAIKPSLRTYLDRMSSSAAATGLFESRS